MSKGPSCFLLSFGSEANGFPSTKKDASCTCGYSQKVLWAQLAALFTIYAAPYKKSKRKRGEDARQNKQFILKAEDICVLLTLNRRMTPATGKESVHHMERCGHS